MRCITSRDWRSAAWQLSCFASSIVGGTHVTSLMLSEYGDPSYTVNTERPFQARNAKAFEFELLAAPSRLPVGKRDQPKPVPLPEQEWLLPGRYVDQVVVARDGSPARLVVPDPRWFALQKLWLA